MKIKLFHKPNSTINILSNFHRFINPFRNQFPKLALVNCQWHKLCNLLSPVETLFFSLSTSSMLPGFYPFLSLHLVIESNVICAHLINGTFHFKCQNPFIQFSFASFASLFTAFFFLFSHIFKSFFLLLFFHFEWEKEENESKSFK